MVELLSSWRAALAGAASVAVLGVSIPASAESVIKTPGKHPDYSVEVEPHFVFQWANRWGTDEGWGPGVRIGVNVANEGFISKVNDSVAVNFGFDLTLSDNNCGWFWHRNDPRFRDDFECSVTEFWVPVAMQWNFWLTDVISVFGEPGFAIAHRRWEWKWYCPGTVNDLCEYDDSDTDFEPVFWAALVSCSAIPSVRLSESERPTSAPA